MFESGIPIAAFKFAHSLYRCQNRSQPRDILHAGKLHSLKPLQFQDDGGSAPEALGDDRVSETIAKLGPYYSVA
jgi:hypothetical protein